MNRLTEAKRHGADAAARAVLAATLDETRGNVSAAARALGTSYTGLRRELRRLGFPPKKRAWTRGEGPWTCSNGHALTGDSGDTYQDRRRGYRVCRRCKTAWEQRSRKARIDRERSAAR